MREQHKKADARAASTNGSGIHWEQGSCSWVGSLQFNCDLREFKHVASAVPTGPPLSPSILTLGIHAGSHRCLGTRHIWPWLSTSTHDATYLIPDFSASPPAFFCRLVELRFSALLRCSPTLDDFERAEWFLEVQNGLTILR